MNRIAWKLIFGLIVTMGELLPLSVQAQDQTISGNLTVSGTMDLWGNVLYLGTHTGSPDTSGWTLGFADGTITTTIFSATSSANYWMWQENAVGVAALQMSLSGSNTLTLYDQSSTPMAKITLNPLGTSTFANSLAVTGTLTVSGTNNQMSNQTLTSSASILTRGLADARYVMPNGSGFVGISTGSPGNELQVGGGTGLDSGAIASFYGTSTSGGVITIGASDASKQAEVGVDGTAGFLTTKSNQPIQFRPDNSTAMTILANGNVGIGTTSPGWPLVVSSSSSSGNSPFLKIANTSGATGNTYGPGIILANGVSGAHDFTINEYQSSASQFAIADTESPFTPYLVIAQSGNVGIGTSSPTSPLTVVNGAAFYQYSDDTNGAFLSFYKARGSQGTPAAAQSGDRLIAFYALGYNSSNFYSGNVAAIQVLAAQNFTSSGEGTSMSFENTPVGATSRSVDMTILGNGNVGIGTTTPATKLEVNGAATIDGTITATAGFMTTPASVATSDIPMFGH